MSGLVGGQRFLAGLCRNYPALSGQMDNIEAAAVLLIECFAGGGHLLVCGNGGSAADSEHIVGELMKSFEAARPLAAPVRKALAKTSAERGAYLAGKLEAGLPAIALTTQGCLASAVANDIDPDLAFAQQVAVYGGKGDVLLGISTSGNARNVIDALIAARAMGLGTIGLAGRGGGRMKPYCGVLIDVPGERTAAIQELHVPVYHVLCRMVEDHFFGKGRVRTR